MDELEDQGPDMEAQVRYFRNKAYQLGLKNHELKLELERVKRKSVARKRNIRSTQKALEAAYIKERSRDKDAEIKRLKDTLEETVSRPNNLKWGVAK
jgi:regulator of replication initiation timing